MEVKNILKALVEDSNLSQVQISRNIGRSDLFIGNYISSGRIPGLELMAKICNTSGHDLLIRNRETGSEIIIEPTSEN